LTWERCILSGEGGDFLLLYLVVGVGLLELLPVLALGARHDGESLNG
jgi:hypothetical protein